MFKCLNALIFGDEAWGHQRLLCNAIASIQTEVCPVSLLVSWYFKPSQPQRIILGLKETFTKRYIDQRSDKAERRPEEQNEKAELLGEFVE